MISIGGETMGTGSCFARTADEGAKRLQGGAGGHRQTGLGIMTDVANLQVREIGARVVLRRLY